MANYDFKQCRAICAELENTLGVYNWREVIEEIKKGNDDFEVAGYRFINRDEIDQVQQEELESDPYILGCFSDWLLADILNMPIEAIEALQKHDFEIVGKMVVDLGKVAELQEQYVRHDGYGHHFAHYDHEEHELESCNFSAFRIE